MDRSFGGNAVLARDHAEIGGALVSLARAMKLRVVAGGVKTREQLDGRRRYR